MERTLEVHTHALQKQPTSPYLCVLTACTVTLYAYPGRTALYHAAHTGNADIVEALLGAGADMWLRNQGLERPLYETFTLVHTTPLLTL